MLVPSLRGLTKRSADIGQGPLEGLPARKFEPDSLIGPGLRGAARGFSEGASNVLSAPARGFKNFGQFLTSRRDRVNQRDAGPTTELDIQKGSFLDSLGIGGREERRGKLLDQKIRRARARLAAGQTTGAVKPKRGERRPGYTKGTQPETLNADRPLPRKITRR